jgi:hypothetical protein
VSDATLVIVSDLHLGGGPQAGAWGPGFGDEFAADQAFSDFLCWLSQRPQRRLVFLGDVFDFLRVPVTGARAGLFARSDAEAVAQLDAIAAAHPAAFSAMSEALRAGVGIDFVSGNHDAELIRPAVRDRLRVLLGGQARFHPWVLYLPGLLYAEHGHHHHDINTFIRPLHPYAEKDGRLERPPAARLGDLRRLPARPARLWRDALAGLRGRPAARARAEYFARLVPAHADEIGLPGGVLTQLHQLASSSPVDIARRLARQRLRGRGGPGYLPTAAAAVHELLARHQLAVPFYTFGHTHAAMRLPLAANAWYLNSGTWSEAAWGGAGPRRTWIEITPAAPPDAAARLYRWTGTAEPLAERRVTA